MKMSEPYYRYLKGYTLDPGFSTKPGTMGINESLYKVRWEDVKPGSLLYLYIMIEYFMY